MNAVHKPLENLNYLLLVRPQSDNPQVVRDAVAIVLAARMLLENPARWNRNATASYGGLNPITCRADDPRADRWSIFGALIKASGMPSGLIPANSALDIAIRSAGFCAAEYGIKRGYPNGHISLTCFNDRWAKDASDVFALLTMTAETMDRWLIARGFSNA